jgi:crotonobetainyl-CoA:carnitine CoA-transferase CaiB-like acyl-CoA transferase
MPSRPRRRDHARVGLSTGNRLYPCLDGWLAVAADRNDTVAALRAVAGVDADDEVAPALGNREVAEVRDAVQAAGVPAEVVNRDGACSYFDDPELRRLRYTVAWPHPRWGTLEQSGAYWSLGDVPTRLDHPTPLLGEHSREILDALGFSSADAQRWLDDGVVVVDRTG